MSKASIPPHWEEAVAACLAKDPAARPQSASELKERLLSPARPPVPMASRPRRPRSKPKADTEEIGGTRKYPTLVVSIVGAIALVLIAGVVWLIEGTATRDEAPAVAPQPSPAPNIVPHLSLSSPVAVMPSSSTRTVDVSPPPAPVRTSRVEIEQMVETHLEAVSSNNSITAASLYGDQVDFLNEGIKSHSTLAQEMGEYFARWPVQKVRRISDVTIEEVDGNEKKVSFSMEFNARSTAGKTSQGSVVVTWIVRRPSPDAEFKIVSQKQETLSRTNLNPPGQSTAVTEQIVQFVAEHFRKTERRDCDAVLSDYASRVDYFEYGMVGKDFIARDCSAYIKAWPEIRLQLTHAVDVRENAAGEYAVSFGYDFEARNKAKGKTSRGHAEDTWRVENSAAGFRIEYHRQTITNRSAR